MTNAAGVSAIKKKARFLFDILPFMLYPLKIMKEIFRFTTVRILRAAVIAAVYSVLTILLAPLSYGPVQIRFSEALTILPLLFPEAVIGVTVGCLIANIFNGMWTDMVFGTLATFTAAVLTYLIGKAFKLSAPVKKFNDAGEYNTAAGGSLPLAPTPFQSAKKRTAGVFLAALPPVLVNALVVPFIIFMYIQDDMANINIFTDNNILLYLLGFCSIFIGQAIAVYGVGIPLYYGVKKIYHSIPADGKQ